MVVFDEKKTTKQHIFKIYNSAAKKLGRHRKQLKKYYPIRILSKTVLDLLKSNFAYVQGSKMYLDDFFKTVSINGVYEETQTEVIKKILKKGEIVLDVGAHIGYYTLLFSKLIGDKGKVFAFEPGPDNFALLKKNVEINGYRNVVLENKAISDKNGKTKLFLAEKNTGDNRIFDNGEYHQSLDVDTITLDDYFKNNRFGNQISLIKMDIQGSEGKAINGMTNLLQKNRNLKLITEFWPYGLINSGTNPIQLLLILSNMGFLPNIICKSDKKLQPTSIDKLEKMDSDFDNNINLLWVRGKS